MCVPMFARCACRQRPADILTYGSLWLLFADLFGGKTEWSRATKYETFFVLQFFF
jgi:hypothetical protein